MPPEHNVALWLECPDNYPERTQQVERVETHISLVFLTDRFAYKLKKPVRFDFLDFSTPQLRHQACQDEVRLNRRLAPGVYLGVVPVCRTDDGQLRLGGAGTPVDWLVHMHRLPDDRSLKTLLAADRLTGDQLTSVVQRLVDFYHELPPEPITAERYRQTLCAHVTANRRVLLEDAGWLDAGTVRRIHAGQLQLLELWPELFAERVRQGRIVQGHGDLRPEHVYLLPDPVMIDCIEFNIEFRRIDMRDEIGFLALECEWLGHAAAAAKLETAYTELTHDDPPSALAAFYRSYRACVRAKVLGLRAGQLAGNERDACRHGAARFLDLALARCPALPGPWVLVVRGVAGSGKSTLASAIATLLGAEHFQTDALRRLLFPSAHQVHHYNEGPYSPENRARVYSQLCRLASSNLLAGQPVVLDGTFLDGGALATAAALARDAGVPLLVITCRCPLEVAAARIQRRLAADTPLSDARAEYLTQQAGQEQRVAVPACEVQTTQPQEQQLSESLAYLGCRLPQPE